MNITQYMSLVKTLVTEYNKSPNLPKSHILNVDDLQIFVESVVCLVQEKRWDMLDENFKTYRCDEKTCGHLLVSLAMTKNYRSEIVWWMSAYFEGELFADKIKDDHLKNLFKMLLT